MNRAGFFSAGIFSSVIQLAERTRLSPSFAFQRVPRDRGKNRPTERCHKLKNTQKRKGKKSGKAQTIYLREFPCYIFVLLCGSRLKLMANANVKNLFCIELMLFHYFRNIGQTLRSPHPSRCRMRNLFISRWPACTRVPLAHISR